MKTAREIIENYDTRMCGSWKCAVRTHMRFSGWESVNCCQNR